MSFYHVYHTLYSFMGHSVFAVIFVVMSCFRVLCTFESTHLALVWACLEIMLLLEYHLLSLGT
jgi:hypothetical protein